MNKPEWMPSDKELCESLESYVGKFPRPTTRVIIAQATAKSVLEHIIKTWSENDLHLNYIKQMLSDLEAMG